MKTSLPNIDLRNEIQTLLSHARAKRKKMFETLKEKPAGSNWCRLYTSLADSIVREIFHIASLQLGVEPAIAVVATGGYGRRELAPYSDIDITFIPKDELDPRTEKSVRTIFHLLIDVFDNLEWKVGYAYRLPSDCPGLDAITRTGLLDARLICGNRAAFAQFENVFYSTFPIADFLIAKIEERNEARKKFHDTPHVIEFHIRDGAGGLRDFQCARWMERVLKLRPKNETRQAVEFLLKARNLLQLASERKQDLLVRTKASYVASLLRVSNDELLLQVQQSAETIERKWLDTLHRIRNSSFELSPRVYASRGECKIDDKADLANAAVGVSRAVRLGLRITRGRIPKEWGDAPRIVECLAFGIQAIHGLEESGLLDEILPELRACRYLPSDDLVHLFTVKEHTMRTIGLLDFLRKSSEKRADVSFSHERFPIEFPPLLSNQLLFHTPSVATAWNDITNLRPLYLAALLHDVGKAFPGKPHSETGAKLAEGVCERLGVSGDEKLSTVWLVREHLTLAKIARTHDLANPKTAFELARICQRKDRLAMLYVLTLADTASVSPENLTPQLASAIHELYEKTKRVMTLENPQKEIALANDVLLRSKAKQQTEPVHNKEELEKFIDTMPIHYLLATPTEDYPQHLESLRKAREGEIVVNFQNRPEAHVTDITICMQDLPKPGLLSRILGIIYALDLTTHSVRVTSVPDSPPIAFDTVSVSFQNHLLPPGICRLVAAELRDRLLDAKLVEELLKKHGKEPKRKQQLLKYTFQEGTPVILDIETPLGRGMPYRVSRMLAEYGWNVEFARIGQWAGKAVARFYLNLPNGRKIFKEDIERALG